MMKSVLCFLVFICLATEPAESSLNVKDVEELIEGLFRNFDKFSDSFDEIDLDIFCPECVDLTTTAVVNESGDEVPALITAILDSTKCRDRSNIDSDNYCVLRIFPGLTWESKFLDVQCKNEDGDDQPEDTSNNV